LAKNKTTYLIFSGGDPLISPHFFKIAQAAHEAGIPISLSTNGTLIKAETAQKLKELGITYVGISLDGLEEANDQVRGQKGAFKRALEGARHCREVGIKVGLRMTLMKSTLDFVKPMVNLALEENFDRIYFSHLVYSGRGEALEEDELSFAQTRSVVKYLIEQTEENIKNERKLEIVTGSNDTDGVFLYRSLKENNDPRAEKIYQKLLARGGNTSGEKILNIDNKGNVYPDQFWHNHVLGNLKEATFEEIWNEETNPFVADLFQREKLLEGRCADCRYQAICRGNNRARAEFTNHSKWASDPACYLTDQEISR